MSRVEWNIGMTLKDVEKKVILKSLDYFEGNKTKVAATLEISLRTIDNKLALYKAQDEKREATRSS